MYRVLIVDDEKPLRDSLKLFDWAGQGCQCVGEASSAEEALRFCRRWAPHIVITDINMPVMNGLALLEQLRAACPSVQVILLTVYQDFAYVQAALRTGAVDYLVKDMNIFQRLPEALARAKAAFERAADRLPRTDFLKEGGQLMRYGPGGVLPEAEAAAFFSRFQGTLATARTQASERALGALLDEWSSAEKDMGMLCFEGGVELLLARSVRESIGRVRSLMGPREGLCFVAGGPVHDAAECLAQHERNLLALENGFYEPLPAVSRAEETRFGSLSAAQGNAWLREILALGLRQDGVSRYVRETVEPAIRQARYAPEQVRAVFERFLQRQEADYASRADMRAWEALRVAPTLSRLVQIYLDCVARLSQAQTGYGYLVDEALRCMADRLAQSELSLQEVADQVQISPGYLSKKLKDATGLSFQEMLIRMRMERAATLLRDGHLMVYEVAERLGYQNYRSFSAAFEKYYHCNPKKYKG